MINIAQKAKHVQEILEKEGVERYKIFVRINFVIDVYIFTSIPKTCEYYQSLVVGSGSPCNVNFKIFPLEDALDPFNASIFMSGENCIDWGARYRFNSLLRNGKNKETKNLQNTLNEIEKIDIPIVTFYSYKGGMGRTTTMIAYAMDLAINQKKKVAILDCDLEAPGYLNFFDLSNHTGLKSGERNGLVEFFSDIQFAKDEDSINISNYMINVGYNNENKVAEDNLDKIWLIPAGNLNEDYASTESEDNREQYLEGLSRMNLANIDTIINGFKCLFKKLKETVSPDIILIDSRTGFNDIFGTVAFYLSKHVVGFFGYNRQTAPGLLNLLSEYYDSFNNFNLSLVSSILPVNADDKWIEEKKEEILWHARSIGNENKKTPEIINLHRNADLERLGTGDAKSDAAFIEIVTKQEFKDYTELFNSLNIALKICTEKEEAISPSTPAFDLRNIILKHLKIEMKSITNFAEDANIKEETFYYRDCMKDFFLPQKFLLQGYKGTGKTYLYKALGDSKISQNLQAMVSSKNECKDTSHCKFVNVLPANRGGFDFKAINYSTIVDTEYYFNSFWQIYAWNSILLDDEFLHIREKSRLKDLIKPISGNDSVLRFSTLIEQGIHTLITIEEDFNALNEYLVEKNIKLFVMYDRLDTCINPIRWSKVVSPLIDFWRENWGKYTNIIPKIFVRTDLFNRIEGTNTARLEANIINLEWSIGEVFGYFFKLIFSNAKATKALWTIGEKFGTTGKQYIKNTQNALRDNYNQFKSCTQAEMDPLIKTVFGKEVNPGKAHLGSPWEYFSRNLANADRESISLRPFINTLNGNAIDEALGTTERFVTEIISPDIYASMKIRTETADTYFKDLTREDFSNDLTKLRDFINSDDGKDFQFKSLTLAQYDEMMKIVFSRIEDSSVVKTVEDLKRMVTANGIMAEKVTQGGKYYRFAPLYWYAWKLSNSKYEKTEKWNRNHETFGLKRQMKDILGIYRQRTSSIETSVFENQVRYFKVHDTLPNGIFDGADVVFDIEKMPIPEKPNYQVAVNIRFEDEC